MHRPYRGNGFPKRRQAHFDFEGKQNEAALPDGSCISDQGKSEREKESGREREKERERGGGGRNREGRVGGESLCKRTTPIYSKAEEKTCKSVTDNKRPEVHTRTDVLTRLPYAHEG